MAGIVAFAEREEGPSRRVGGAGYAGCVGLQEVYAVFEAAVYGAGDYGEELEEDAAGEEDDGDEGEDWSCWG